MPVLDTLSFEIVSHSGEQTQRIGARLGALLPSHMVIALMGQMGAGKTYFSKGIGLGWGATQPLRSPTFTLIQEHHRSADDDTLYHIDLYRAERAADLRGIGLDEIFEDEHAVALVEWAERAEDMLPNDTLLLHIDVVTPTKRRLTFSTKAESTWQVLQQLRQSVYGVGND